MNSKLTPFNHVLAPVVMIALVSAACGSTQTSASEAGSTTTAAPTTEASDVGEAVETVDPEEPATEELDDSEDASPTDVAVVAADDPVLVWTETGGCIQAGPNCARYVVTGDGTVNTYRGDSEEVAASGTVSEAALADWLAVTAETDVGALVDRAGPGEMRSAFDGIDFILEAPHTDTSLSSVDLEFSPSEDYFAAATALVSSAADAAPLDIELR